MKKVNIISIMILSMLLFSVAGTAQNNEINDHNYVNKIEVIDFHSTHRCMTCNAIEANTKYTLEEYFADELKSGLITFQSINIDEKENFKLAEKFQATGTSLYLNVIYDGNEHQVNLTNFAFLKGKDKESFSKELKKKIEKQLKAVVN
ncbi:MAG: nitrophenyl compound nitroreductase subunit ArsF family protein [Bacteroidota bacterium]